MKNFMSVSEYAKYKGVDCSPIYRRLKIGEFDRAVVQRDPLKLDVETMDRLYSVDLSKQNRKKIKRGPAPAKKTVAKKVLKEKRKEINDDLQRGDLDIAEAKRLIEIVKLELAEIELAEKRKEMFKFSEIEKTWFEILRNIRDKFGNDADHQTPVLFACGTENELNELLNDEINKVLTELAETPCLPGLKSFNEMNKKGENYHESI